jgi:lysophospholipase L1-like esterase
MTFRLRAGLVVFAFVATACTASAPVHAHSTPPRATQRSASTLVLAEGDSITEYVGAGHDRDAWPVRLRNRLCGVDCTEVVNNGHGGTCLDAVGCGAPGSRLVDTWQAEVIGRHPTTVVVDIGTNDLWFPDTSVNQMSDGYKQIVYSALDAGIQPLILTIGPLCPNAGPYGFLESRREQMNNWLLSYFGSGPTSVVIDTANSLRVPWGQQIDPHFAKTGCDGTDSMHMNPWGLMVLADAISLDRIR